MSSASKRIVRLIVCASMLIAASMLAGSSHATELLYPANNMCVTSDAVEVGGAALVEIRVLYWTSASALLRYDPNRLQIVDDQGQPTERVELPNALDPEAPAVQNRVDALAGEVWVHVPAKRTAEACCLARMHIKALQPGTTALDLVAGTIWLDPSEWVWGTFPVSDGVLHVLPASVADQTWLPLINR